MIGRATEEKHFAVRRRGSAVVFYDTSLGLNRDVMNAYGKIISSARRRCTVSASRPSLSYKCVKRVCLALGPSVRLV